MQEEGALSGSNSFEQLEQTAKPLSPERGRIRSAKKLCVS